MKKNKYILEMKRHNFKYKFVSIILRIFDIFCCCKHCLLQITILHSKHPLLFPKKTHHSKFFIQENYLSLKINDILY